MTDKFNITGRTNSNGEPMFSGIDRWKDFFRQFPDKTFICEITIMEPYTEESMTWFYVKVVLPAIKKRWAELGEIKTLEEIDVFFREKYNFLLDEEKKHHKRIFDFDSWKPIHECTLFELTLYIESINEFCAITMDIIIGKEYLNGL